MMTGGETIECDTSPPPTIRMRLRRLWWWTYGLIKYRMMECTGYLKWKHRYMKGPIPEGYQGVSRPPHWIRTPWFWLRGVLGNVEHRFQMLTGWYTISAQIAFTMLRQQITPPVLEKTALLVTIDGEEQTWIVSRKVMDRIAKSIGGVR